MSRFRACDVALHKSDVLALLQVCVYVSIAFYAVS